ncbi:MAG: outer membrane protein assembly factor BamE [Candidatus Omnitrophica bacterium]|nr:outer membrane protein assembly factor BamE [Candidatus Omnitrophota bacterium]
MKILQSVLLAIFVFTASLMPQAHASDQNVPLLTDKLVRKIKPGMTRQEVKALVGEPVRIQENKDGTQIWFYERKAKRSRPPAPELPNPMPDIGRLEIGAKVKFNAEGIAVHVKQRISETDRKSRLVTKEQFEQEMGS